MALPTLAISNTTVSGAGYGGDMAVQLHVAFSSVVSGVCAVDAQPFACATTWFPDEPLVEQRPGSGVSSCRGCPPQTVGLFGASATLAFDHCRATPEVVDVGMLPDYPRRTCGGEGGQPGCLDDTTNLYADRVHLRATSAASRAIVANTAALYAQLLTDSTRQMRVEMEAAPSDGAAHGACLAHMHGATVPPDAPPPPPLKPATVRGGLRSFSQAAYGAQPSAGWAAEGLLYVPSGCHAARCALHVALHDCGTRAAPWAPPRGSLSASEVALAAFAEARGIVLLLPRLQSLEAAAAGTPNGGGSGGDAPPADALDVRRGCWDVFGQL
eukprot:3076711-Prymnesium_polylepis.1